jgi:hypothetical protein
MKEELIANLREDLREALIQAAKIKDDVIREYLVNLIEKWLILTKP